MIREYLKRLSAINEMVKSDPMQFIDKDKLYYYVTLGDFTLKPYLELIVELNLKRKNNPANVENLKELYKMVYKNQLSSIRYARRRVESETLYSADIFYDKEGNKIDSKQFILHWLDGAANKCKSELYLLENVHSAYGEERYEIIGNGFESRFQSDCYIYKDTYICRMEPHTFGLYYTENTHSTDKRVLLNIVAYYSGKPFYYLTDNPHFNNDLEHLYSAFNLFDLLKLRHDAYYKEDQHASGYICKPVFKLNNLNVFTEIKEVPHPQMLDSYHDSLKQFEPLPRCVFLYRVFEYASAVDYQPTFKPSKYNPEDAIEYYYNCAMNYNFSVLYYPKLVRKSDGKVLLKTKHINFVNDLKKESISILKEWNLHSYLKQKSIGEIVYVTGRNRVAHGGVSNYGITYDYDKNYKHINNVNIILELIARYVIEKLNPSIRNLTETKKVNYSKY